MGAFKPLLPFGAQTVIESGIDHLRRAGLSEIIVVTGHRAPELRERLAHLPVKFAHNPAEQSEMSESLARGLEVSSDKAKSFLIALVDQPAVNEATIGQILDAHARAPLVIPTWQGRGGHPVLIDARYRDELRALDPSTGLRSLFERHRADVCRLEVESPYVVRDIDTWEDYETLHREIFGQPPAASRLTSTNPPASEII